MAIAAPRERLDAATISARLEPERPPRRPRRRPPRPRRGAPSRPRAAPPAASSGAAYSSSTGSGASARAVTRSLRAEPVRPLLGARVDDLDVRRARAASAAALEEGALAAHALDQRDAGAGSATPAPGPGNPAPEPRSAIAGRRGPPAARAPRASRRRGRRRASAGSRTAVIGGRLGRDQVEEHGELPLGAARRSSWSGRQPGQPRSDVAWTPSDVKPTRWAQRRHRAGRFT